VSLYDAFCPEAQQPCSVPGTPSGTLTDRLRWSNNVLYFNGLGLSPDTRATGLQAVAPVQMNAQKQIGVTKAGFETISARLLNLRGGARGFVVSQNESNTEPAPPSSLPQQSKPGGRGGAASADEALEGPLGGFVNVGYNWGNVDQTDRQDAYKFGNFNAILGLDYRVSDSLVLGGALSYGHTNSSYEQSLGSVKADTVSVSLYGTYYRSGFYVDGALSYGHIGYDTVRNISMLSQDPTVASIIASATAKPSGDQWAAFLGAGYDIETTTATLTPFARLGYITVRNKAFQESEPTYGLGLAVEDRTVNSLQSALGIKIAKSIDTSYGVVVPYATAQWLHEFKNDNPSILSKYVSDPFNTFFFIPTEQGDPNYAVFTLGASATFERSLSAFAQFSTAEWLSNVRSYGVVLGLRKQF